MRGARLTFSCPTFRGRHLSVRAEELATSYVAFMRRPRPLPRVR